CFLSMLQQGVMRAWERVSVTLGRLLGEKPHIVASAMSRVLERYVFNDMKRLFTKANSYLQMRLFEGERIKVNDFTRPQWQSLILACFFPTGAQTILKKSLNELTSNSKTTDVAIAVDKVAEI